MLKNLLLAALTATALSGAVPAALAQEPVRGGTLTVATIGEPPTLDPMVNPTDLVAVLSMHIFETLYTFDENMAVTPLIATELPAISSDGLVYDIAIRDGLTFHDGSVLDADDVVASLQRWIDMTSRGKLLEERLGALEKTSDHSVRITLTSPFAPLLALLANPSAAAIILPTENNGPELTSYIGNGPYMLKEWAPDQYVQLVRFDDYVSREGEPDGYGGARQANVDEIRFVPVPNSNTRVEGAIAGQFDYTDAVPIEMQSRIQGSASEPTLIQLQQWLLIQPNHRQGPLSDLGVRKAAMTALNMDEVMLAAFGDPQFFKLEGNMYPEGNPWYSTAGAENYNPADHAKAAEALAATSYNGEPVRIITSRQYEFQYRAALVIEANLDAVGFNAEVQVMDYATMTQSRRDPSLYEIYLVNSPFPPDPGLIPILTRGSNGFWESDTKIAMVDEMNAAADPAARKAIWDRVHALFYEEGGLFMAGKFSDLVATSPKLHGVTPAIVPFFWNAWLEQ